MRRLSSSLALAFIFGVCGVRAASAQQAVEFFMGGFTPTSMDSRGTDDVLFQNSAFLSTLNRTAGIDINQFNGFTFGGDYLVNLGHYAEAGMGIGYYQKTATTTYTDFVNANGTEIFQDLQLRIVPFSATVRVLPFGHNGGIEPYVGGGVGVFVWRYSETGQFIDTNNNIFQGNFVGSGATVGPIVLGGVRFPIGPATVGGEVRWQSATADLPAAQTFAGSKINLGGFNYLFNMGFRF